MKAGWQTKQLGEVLSVLRNGVNCKQDKSGVGDKISRIESISEASFDITKVGYAKLDAKDKSKHQLQRGDILFSHINSAVHVGKTAVFDSDETVYHGVNLLLLRPVDALLSSYLERALKFIFESGYWRSACKQSVNQASVNQQDISCVPISYPTSLSEQERIVGILDEAFDGIAKAKATAEANLQNARALFQSHLQTVFSQKGEGWEEKPFEELIESNVIGVIKSSREQGEDKEWPYVKMNNITRDNRFDFSNYTSVDATAEEVKKYSLSDGDFLFNTRNSHELVGKSCIYESDSNDAVLFNNNIMRIRFKSGIDARFILLAFSSKSVADGLNALKSGTTNVSAIYFKDLKSLMIPVPSVIEQKRITVALKSLSAETQRLESLYQNKVNALDELKKSLLHQAFTGNL
jgi:type I restriction enzyme S subunit